jgi:hypothetical protein
MNWLCKHLGRATTATHRAVAPRVEELESRRVPSVATFTVASDIVHSAENLQNFVTSEYVNLLHRSPDSAGFANWVGQMEAGLSPATVDAAFVASPEYILNHGNNTTQWLNGIYQDLLGRSIDATGLTFWTSQLSGGASAFAVAAGIETSVERDSIIVAQDYLRFLNRSASTAEIDFWASQMEKGVNAEAVASAIVGSPEFFQIHGNTNSGFITSAYQTLLNRTPTTSELDFWLAVMNSIRPPTI